MYSFQNGKNREKSYIQREKSYIHVSFLSPILHTFLGFFTYIRPLTYIHFFLTERGVVTITTITGVKTPSLVEKSICYNMFFSIPLGRSPLTRLTPPCSGAPPIPFICLPPLPPPAGVWYNRGMVRGIDSCRSCWGAEADVSPEPHFLWYNEGTAAWHKRLQSRWVSVLEDPL